MTKLCGQCACKVLKDNTGLALLYLLITHFKLSEYHVSAYVDEEGHRQVLQLPGY